MIDELLNPSGMGAAWLLPPKRSRMKPEALNAGKSISQQPPVQFAIDWPIKTMLLLPKNAVGEAEASFAR